MVITGISEYELEPDTQNAPTSGGADLMTVLMGGRPYSKGVLCKPGNGCCLRPYYNHTIDLGEVKRKKRIRQMFCL
jgi:hypothetical protein